MNRAKVESNKETGEFGNTPLSKVFFMVLGIILVMAFILNVFFRDEGVVLQHDVRSLGYVEVEVTQVEDNKITTRIEDRVLYECRRHVGPNNEVGPCPEDWVRYRQVHVASEREQREIEAALVQLTATRRE